MELEVYGLLDIAELGDAASNEGKLGSEELTQIISNLKTLSHEIDSMSERFRVTARDNIVESVYFDFDIIFSAINWLQSLKRYEGIGTKNSFWASLCIDLYADKAQLLPGTLFELLNFLNRQNDVSHKYRSSPIADVFIHKFFTSNVNSDEGRSVFLDSINLLRHIDFGETTYFVLKNIFDHMRIDSEISLDYDPDVFQSAYYSLSVGRRKDQYVNNRVDALNFAICAHQSKTEMGAHHSIISNARAMQTLSAPYLSTTNASWHLLRQENHVLSARHAALYELIKRFVPTPSDGEEICRAWLKNVNQLSDDLRDMRAAAGDGFVKVSDLSDRDSLLNLVWLFEGVQKQISAIKHAKIAELNLFRKKYRQDQHKMFINDIRNKASRQLEKSTYREMIGSSEKIMEIDISRIDASDITSAFEIHSGDGNVNFSVENRAIRIWGRIDIDFENFVENVNHLNTNICQKFFVNQYDFDSVVSKMGDGSAFDFMHRCFWQIHTANNATKLEARLDRAFERSIIDNVIESSGEELVFLRFVSPIYSTSFDGTMMATYTEYAIVSDLRKFFDNCLSGKSRIMRDKKVSDRLLESGRQAGLTQLSQKRTDEGSFDARP